MQKIISLVLIVVFFTACAGNHKRIIVMSKGPAVINEDAKTIVAKDGNGHEEKVINLSGADIQLKLNTPAGEAQVELKENGLYILNVKNDTIIGSYQKYTAPKLTQNLVTQEELKSKIDSLQQLTAGKNISAANRNYFILPNQAVKITDNLDAFIVGPYHQMRSAEKVDGKEPEVYRFYSIREIRETISKLEALTRPTAPAN